MVELTLFRTRHSDLRHRNEQRVTILGETPRTDFDPAAIDDNTAPMMRVRFEDGAVHDVYQDELKRL